MAGSERREADYGPLVEGDTCLAVRPKRRTLHIHLPLLDHVYGWFPLSGFDCAVLFLAILINDLRQKLTKLG